MKYLAALIIVAGLAAAPIIAADASGMFAVKQVDVRGVESLDPQIVAPVLKQAVGTSLLRTSPDMIAAKMLEQLPVMAVSVKRRWPSAIEVEITERKPVLQSLEDGGLWWMDREGIRLRSVLPAEMGDAPIVRGCGMVTELRPECRRRAAAVASMLEAGPFGRLKPSEFSVSGRDITLWLESGARIDLGEDALLPRLQRIDAILKEFEHKEVDVRWIDGTSEDRSYVAIRTPAL